MNALRTLLTAAACAALLLSVPAAAEEPAGATFSPAPPGTIVQNQVVYLGGESMHAQWRAVASRKLVASANGTDYDQWYLSVYALDGSVYRLRYRSPDAKPLSRVTQAVGGAKMWFPLQTLRIVGAAELMRADVQQLVVSSHESGADCGTATVTIFTLGAGGSVVAAASLRNGCDLTAAIAHGHGTVRDSVVLGGPYYNATAPLCCPTKAKAAAVLGYRNGAWQETPKYFALFPGKFPPE